MCLIYINIGIKNVVFANFFPEKFWRFGKSVYLCTRKSGTPPDEQARKSSLKELHRQKQVVQEAAALRFPFGLAVPSGNKTDRQDDKVFLELGMKDSRPEQSTFPAVCLMACRQEAKIQIFYNEEFDPGSG